MTSHQLKLLIELIDAKIQEHAAKSDEDHLIESMNVYRIIEELEKTTQEFPQQ